MIYVYVRACRRKFHLKRFSPINCCNNYHFDLKEDHNNEIINPITYSRTDITIVIVFLSQKFSGITVSIIYGISIVGKTISN